MLYLKVWAGEDTDWITLTPNNPDDCESSEFDEGMCTGFKVKCEDTINFRIEFLTLLQKYDIKVK